MKDILLDIITHTHSLGVLPMLRLDIDDDSNLQICSNSDDKATCIMLANMHQPVPEFSAGSTIGMSNLEKVNLLLKNPEYEKDGVITVVNGTTQNGVDVSRTIHFKNASGDFQNEYRLVSPQIIEAKYTVPVFKGANWECEFTPSLAAISRMKLMTSLHNEENLVQIGTKETGGKHDLYLSWGDANTHAGEYVFQEDVGSEIKFNSYISEILLKVLSLTGDITMSVTGNGLLKFRIDTGLGEYEYYFPAQAK